MAVQLDLMDEINEIENVTEVKGCLLIKADTNTVIHSTIKMDLDEDTRWEITVLRDTFQQFSRGLKHGTLNDLTLEGDHGFIFLYVLPPRYLLMLIGPKDINLAYLKMGMYDIIERITAKVEEEEARLAAEAEARRKAEEEARRKAEEEARRKAEEEARRKAEEEARRKAEEEARRKAEEEARRKAEEEAKRKAEEARRKAEEEARRKAEEEAKRKAEEEAKRIAKLKEEARKQAEEEARRRAEEARKKAEEEAKRKAEEARRKAEEEARKKAEEEARQRAEEEARRKAEEEARRKAEEEARRKAEEARRKAEEEARRKEEAPEKIIEMLEKLPDQTTNADKHAVLEDALELLLFAVDAIKGERLSELLADMKETILLQVGTSLALYDIARKSRELAKVETTLPDEELKAMRMSIQKWKERLIK